MPSVGYFNHSCPCQFLFSIIIWRSSFSSRQCVSLFGVQCIYQESGFLNKNLKIFYFTVSNLRLLVDQKQCHRDLFLIAMEIFGGFAFRNQCNLILKCKKPSNAFIFPKSKKYHIQKPRYHSIQSGFSTEINWAYIYYFPLYYRITVKFCAKSRSSRLLSCKFQFLPCIIFVEFCDSIGKLLCMKKYGVQAL